MLHIVVAIATRRSTCWRHIWRNGFHVTSVTAWRYAFVVTR